MDQGLPSDATRKRKRGVKKDVKLEIDFRLTGDRWNYHLPTFLAADKILVKLLKV